MKDIESGEERKVEIILVMKKVRGYRNKKILIF